VWQELATCEAELAEQTAEQTSMPPMTVASKGGGKKGKGVSHSFAWLLLQATKKLHVDFAPTTKQLTLIVAEKWPLLLEAALKDPWRGRGWTQAVFLLNSLMLLPEDSTYGLEGAEVMNALAPEACHVPTQLSASSRVTLLRLAGCSGKLPETPVAALEVMQRTMRKLVMVPDRTKQDEDTQSAVGLLAVLMDVAEAMRVWCAASASSHEQKVLALADYSSGGSFEAYFRYRPGQPLAARHTARAWDLAPATIGDVTTRIQLRTLRNSQPRKMLPCVGHLGNSSVGAVQLRSRIYPRSSSTRLSCAPSLSPFPRSTTQAWAWYSFDRGFIRDRQARA